MNMPAAWPTSVHIQDIADFVHQHNIDLLNKPDLGNLKMPQAHKEVEKSLDEINRRLHHILAYNLLRNYPKLRVDLTELIIEVLGLAGALNIDLVSEIARIMRERRGEPNA